MASARPADSQLARAASSARPADDNARPNTSASVGPTRPAGLPDLPTVAEQGLPGFSATSWWGFVGPAKMPEAVKTKLIEATRKVLSSPEVIKHMRDLSAEPGDAFGKDFAAFMAAEEKKWGEVVRVSGAKAE